jgi:WD40 repeat protein
VPTVINRLLRRKRRNEAPAGGPTSPEPDGEPASSAPLSARPDAAITVTAGEVAPEGVAVLGAPLELRTQAHSWGDGPPPGPRSQNLRLLNANLEWQDRAENITRAVEGLGIRKGDPVLLTSTFGIEYPGIFERVIPGVGTIEFVEGRGPSGDGTEYVQKIDRATLRELEPDSRKPGEQHLTGEMLRIKAHGVRDIAFSPDGDRIAASGDAHTVCVWDGATGAEQLRLELDSLLVNHVVFSPDGSRVATADHDGVVHVFDAASGVERLRLEYDWEDASREDARSRGTVAFSPDGARLATVGKNSIKVRDAWTGESLLRIDCAGANALALSGDGTRLGAVVETTVRLFDATTGVELRQIPQGEPIIALAFNRDGTRLATGGYEHTASVWDASSGAELVRIRHNADVQDVAFSPDGARIATASGGYRSASTAHVWDADSGRELVRIKDFGERAVAFSPDGEQLATDADAGSAVRDGCGLLVWNVGGANGPPTGGPRSAVPSPPGPG